MEYTVYMTVDSLDSSTGGPARSVPRLSQAVAATGVDVELFANSFNRDGENNNQPGDNNVNEDYLREFKRKLQYRKNRDGCKTIVHNHGIWLASNHQVAKQAQKNKVPFIISPRGMLEPWSMNYKWIKKQIAWYLYQQRDLTGAAVLHATSRLEAENLYKLNLGVPIVVIPNGVDVPHLPNLPPSELYYSKPLQALFLSRIHPKKGLLLLLRAWEKISPPGWQLLLVGPDELDHKKEVEREIKSLGLEKTVFLQGEVDDASKWDLYRNADLFILPSRSENFGIVVAEALSVGVPVITTKGTPWSGLLEHRCGWWVDADVDALAISLDEAVSMDREDRLDMGRRGRKFVEENYSWSKIGIEMIGVYEWVLGVGETPQCLFIPIDH